VPSLGGGGTGTLDKGIAGGGAGFDLTRGGTLTGGALTGGGTGIGDNGTAGGGAGPALAGTCLGGVRGATAKAARADITGSSAGTADSPAAAGDVVAVDGAAVTEDAAAAPADGSALAASSSPTDPRGRMRTGLVASPPWPVAPAAAGGGTPGGGVSGNCERE
jgi:hypothetical protein